ncbi:MAG: phosphoribosylaminoimidazolesuccinocarboxamide synthase [Candidatus Omnitrophica bacterium]|nr:phosphoribosylaminoimidazolesuccinocarboxamide synthase [Candidatus Omnitrophota bacterium]MBU1996783.1 phosphoribosylaminoimidazolesuccinocarboxamide synthase [Candidatus Omnitrophota bacterium]MBU4334665.1 phosphoribosylaminoimidazolesuccinocarboxamide synthase [Candidatus Omnitrophota bacterium]
MSGHQFKNLKLEGLEFKRSGKVRDIYSIDDKLLMIASDRISCFDVVLPTSIPRKGEILTKISVFWFNFTKDIISNHLITHNVEEFPLELIRYKNELEGRSMLVKKADPIPFECIVRGYLSGSVCKEYHEKQTICGIKMPEGLKESDKLPYPIFTPTTKEEEGHDMNVPEEYVEKALGKELTKKLKDTSIAIYKKASEYAESKGIIIADTKFEFGTTEKKSDLILIDEVLTPDSSRFWPRDMYAPGRSQPSFDKQYVRDYLETLDWDKTYPGPELPDEIVQKTSEKYQHALKIITG